MLRISGWTPKAQRCQSFRENGTKSSTFHMLACGYDVKTVFVIFPSALLSYSRANIKATEGQLNNQSLHDAGLKKKAYDLCALKIYRLLKANWEMNGSPFFSQFSPFSPNSQGLIKLIALIKQLFREYAVLDATVMRRKNKINQRL